MEGRNVNLQNMEVPGVTTEGVAAVLALLLGIGKAAGWFPPELDTTATAATVALLCISVARGLAKLFTKGTVPFVPKGESPGVAMPMVMACLLAVVVACALLLVGPANAEPIASAKRAAGGVAASYGTYQYDSGAASHDGFVVSPYLSYSITERLSAAARADCDPGNDLYVYRAGGRLCVVGNEPADRVGLYFAVDWVTYDGDDAATYLHEQSALYGVNASWLMLTTKGGRDLLYGDAQVSRDADNGTWRVLVGLKGNLFGGGL